MDIKISKLETTKSLDFSCYKNFNRTKLSISQCFTKCIPCTLWARHWKRLQVDPDPVPKEPKSYSVSFK